MFAPELVTPDAYGFTELTRNIMQKRPMFVIISIADRVVDRLFMFHK